ncbi:hypothetical protein [Pareuzebyella sediminis]|uniref:hypothetical protein n=1 Tax=Pareuzebyella sediminis TaxID=2607998 RepID=UPI0011EEF8F0|nr:hypothetical protein [Pareuzebyella sediminis]
MGLKSYFSLVLTGCAVFYSCRQPRAKSDIEVTFNQDTITVGYTYWWPQSGPFIGNCGDELSLVFSGIIVEMGEPNDRPGPLYVAQDGTIELEQVYKIKEIGKNTYANQKFFKSDCFYGLNLNVGDSVLVFCYDYDDNYSIPGEKSIVKIISFEDPLIQSIKKYIDTDQDAISIEKDTSLWVNHDLKSNLKQILECHRNE